MQTGKQFLCDIFMFQSAPGREAGRCDYQVVLKQDGIEFQSAPGREAGRCW